MNTVLGLNKDRIELILLIILMITVAIGAIILNRFALQSFPNSADEHAYLFQAKTFAMGRLWVPAHPKQEFISPFYIHTHQDRVFSIFPPGWPMILSIGVLLGIEDWINPIISALSVGVVFGIGRLLIGRMGAWVSVGLLIISPFFLFNAASYFSHPACLLGVSLTTFFLLLWNKNEINWTAIAAGLALGWTCCVRELTCIAILIIPVIYTIWQSQQRLKLITQLIIGALPMAILYLIYNAELTGHWFLPVRFILADEWLGFGTREIRLFDYIEKVYYGPSDALRNLLNNNNRLILWTFPGLPILGLIGIWHNRSNGWTWALMGSVLLLPLSYMLYPSDGGNQYGPRFYYESMVYWAILASLGIRGIIEQIQSRKGENNLIVVLSLLLITDGMIFWNHVDFYHEQIYKRRTLFRLVDRFDLENAIVFVGAPSGDMTQGDLIRNHPIPSISDVIFAWDLGDKNNALLEQFPDRQGYLFRQNPQTGIYSLKSLRSRLGYKSLFR